jgi:hypothetical protein
MDVLVILFSYAHIALLPFNKFCLVGYNAPLKVERHFGVTYRFHLYVRRVHQARNQQEAGSLLALFACTEETIGIYGVI